MALHATGPVDCLAPGTHRHRQPQLTERQEIIALHSLSLGIVIGQRDAISSVFTASSAPSAACVPSVAAPLADVPSSLRSTRLQWPRHPVLALISTQLRSGSLSVIASGGPSGLCVKVGLVKRVHTLFGRNAQQVVYELEVEEEVEGVRQEMREVKGEIKVEESRSLHERTWMG